MVKFARHLAAECVPEWREAYVDYKRLKKVLSAVRDGVDDFGSGRSSQGAGGARGGSTASSEGSVRSVTVGGVRALLHRTRERARAGDSDAAMSPVSANARPGTERPRRRGHPRGAEGLIDVRWSAPGRDGAPQTTVAPSTVHGETDAFPEEQCFFSALDAETRKVNAFFLRTEEQFAARFDDILAALARRRAAAEAARLAAATAAAKPGASMLRRRKGSAPQLADGEDPDDGDAAANEAANARTLDVGAFSRLRARGTDAFPNPFPRPPAEAPAEAPRRHRRGLSMEEVGAFVGAHLSMRGTGGAAEAQQGVELGRVVSTGLARDEDAAERGGSAHGGTHFAFGAPTPSKRVRLSGAHLHLPHLHLPSLPLPALPTMHLPGPSAADAALRDAKQLRRAMVEFYRGLGLLTGYAGMNATAITKILKKHDKCTGWATSQVYLTFVDRAHFRTAEHNLEAMRRAIEREFEALEVELVEAAHHASSAAPGDSAARRAADLERRRTTHRNALAKLRPPPPHAPTAATLLAAGAACGAALCVFANVLALLKQAHSRPAAADHVAAMLPVLRGPLLMLAHFALYGAAVAAWSRVRISYAFIFGAAPGTEMLFAEYLLLAGTLATLWLVAWAGILADLVARTGGAAASAPDGGVMGAVRATGLVPVLLLAAVVVAFAVPLPERLPTWPPRSSRWFFAGTVGRMLAAPFFAVKLPDFFMADQLTSQLQGISDLLYTSCYYMSGAYALRPSAAAGVCLNGRGGLTAEVKLALCLVPFWLRILQCVRRLRDERARLHAVNIGKYTAGAASLVFRYLRDTRPPNAGWTAVSALVSLGSSAYSYGWDLVMDWGLLRPSKAHPGLRDVLMVKEPRLYYFAMGLNALLRLTWIASLVRWPNPGAGHDLVLPSVLALVEVLRRCFWNYFRIENEQVANTGQFRAVAAVPLPGGSSKGGAKAAKLLPQPPPPPLSPGSPTRRRVSFDDLPAFGHRGRSGRGEDEAAALLEEEAPAASPAECEPPQQQPVLQRTASDWDRTSKALKRVGTMASFLSEDGEPIDPLDDPMRSDREAPESAPLEAATSGARAATPTRRERPAGEHFTWEDGEHSDDE